MGVDKATLPFGPELMLQRVVRLLSEVVSPIVVVAARGQTLPALSADVIVARDEREGRGPLEGLHAGLSAVPRGTDAVYATSCDVPLLATAFVEELIRQVGEHDVVVPVDGKFHHPLAAVYRTSVAETIAGLLSEDQLRPVFLYDRVDTRRVPIEELRAVDPQLDTLMNLNRPEDYETALASQGFSPPA